MDLLWEVKKAWGVTEDKPSWFEDTPISKQRKSAQSDYVDRHRYLNQGCGPDKTYTLIRDNLLLALSCPNEYVREWGRLVAKEKKDAQCR